MNELYMNLQLQRITSKLISLIWCENLSFNRNEDSSYGLSSGL